MEGFNDVFISYGRGESKAFAAKLNKHLVSIGKHVWLDLEDIPLGIDFQEQIDTGIEKADNFIFIIAPHSIKSEFCLKEILLAIKYNKRIIPILHIEPSEKTVWDKLHPAIGKLNWVYMRQTLDQTKPQAEWDIIDDFDKSFLGLEALLALDINYIFQHTHFLNKALAWERHQKQNSYFLIDDELKQAEKWMLTEFVAPQQPPCIPAPLHAQYIADSKKWANFSMPDVFISYAREDVIWRDKIRHELSIKALTSWTDVGDIKSGMSFEEAINKGIEQSDSFVFLISPSAIKSKYCLLELDYVLQLNKRVIPIMVEAVNDDEIPAKIKGIQYINFTLEDDPTQVTRKSKTAYERSVDLLINELKSDADYYRLHKLILVQQMEWDRSNKLPSLLFRGFQLLQIEAWLKTGMAKKVNKPLPLQIAFVEECSLKAHEIVCEVFICFDPSDNDLAQRVNRELNLFGKTTWFDHQYISSDTNYEQELIKGIEGSDNFLLVCSLKSLENEFIKKMISFAVDNNKRIIPIYKNEGIEDNIKLLTDTNIKVDFQSKTRDFSSSFSELLRVIDTDKEHVTSHTKWLKRSIDWQNASKSKDLLVTGTEFEIYAIWYEATLTENKKPGIAKVQEAFFLSGKNAKRKKIILRNIVALSLLALTILSVIAGGVAMVQKKIAQKNAQEAKDNANIAKQNEAKAVKNKLLADANAERASLNEKKAKISAAEALKNAQIAKANELEALKNKAEAVENMTLAQKNELIANENRAKALMSKKKAELEGFAAKFSNDEASFEKFLTKANELAIQSTNINEKSRADVKMLLSLGSYRLYRSAYDNLKANLQHKFDTLLKFEDKSMPQYNTVMELHNRLKEMSKTPIEPNRTYRSLREAFLFNQNKDTITPSESWASIVLKDGSILLNDRFGKLKVLTIKYNSDRLPSKASETMLGGSEMVFATSFVETNESIFCGTQDGQIVSWMKGNWKNMNHIGHINGKILSMAESSKYKLIFYSIGSEIYKLDLSTNKSSLFVKTKSIIRSIIWVETSTEGMLLTGSDKGEIIAYPDMLDANKSIKLKVNSPSSSIYSMDYNKAKGLMVVGFAEGQILLIQDVTISNINSQKTLSSYVSDSKHNGIVKAVTFSKNGNYLATGSLDNKIFFWDMTNKSIKEVAQSAVYYVLTLDNKILSLAISPDNQYLLFNDEKMLHVTANNSLTYYSILCKLKKRDFTEKEFQQYFKSIKLSDCELCK